MSKKIKEGIKMSKKIKEDIKMSKKIKNAVFLFIALIATFNFGCQFNNPNIEDNNNNSHQYDNQTVTHTTAINITDPTDRSEMVEQYLEATATIYVETPSTSNMGSGIAVYAGGYIATNYHVILNAIDNSNSTIEVEILIDGEYQVHPADLLWYNDVFDMAILRSAYYNIPYVKMLDRWIYGDNLLRIAEDVWTLGTPFYNSLCNSYSFGAISNNAATDKRNSTASGRLYEHLIQHSAPISPGSSGSGLFDKSGNLVGLNALGVSEIGASNLFFAVPIYPLINVISQVAELNEDDDDSTNYKFPTMGIMGYDKILAAIHDEKASEIEKYNFNEDGLYVKEVSFSGPSFGELYSGNIITGISPTTSNINGEGYFEVILRNDLLYALSTFQVGDTIKVYYKSGTVNNTVEITLS